MIKMIFKHKLKIGFGLAIVACLLLFVFLNRSGISSLPDYPRKTGTINGQQLTLLETQTAEERALGLGVVEKLPKNHGMIFPGQKLISIWMKGMKFPIDIIWLDKDNRVIHTVRDARPESYPQTTFINPKGTDARMVIELNTGDIERLNIKNGDVFEIN